MFCSSSSPSSQLPSSSSSSSPSSSSSQNQLSISPKQNRRLKGTNSFTKNVKYQNTGITIEFQLRSLEISNKKPSVKLKLAPKLSPLRTTGVPLFNSTILVYTPSLMTLLPRKVRETSTVVSVSLCVMLVRKANIFQSSGVIRFANREFLRATNQYSLMGKEVPIKVLTSFFYSSTKYSSTLASYFYSICFPFMIAAVQDNMKRYFLFDLLKSIEKLQLVCSYLLFLLLVQIFYPSIDAPQRQRHHSLARRQLFQCFLDGFVLIHKNMRAFIILIEIIYLWIPGVEQIPQSSIKTHDEAIKYVFWLNLFENKISLIKSDTLCPQSTAKFFS